VRLWPAQCLPEESCTAGHDIGESRRRTTTTASKAAEACKGEIDMLLVPPLCFPGSASLLNRDSAVEPQLTRLGWVSASATTAALLHNLIGYTTRSGELSESISQRARDVSGSRVMQKSWEN
jgi:hypothetical protein